MSHPSTSTPSRTGPVVIISASVGAGHDGAAGELARRLAAAGATVRRHDFLDLLPVGLGPLVSAGYLRMLNHAPYLYERVYRATGRRGGGHGPLTTAVLRAAEHRTVRALPPDTRAVVSTYPLASQVLGALRRTGRLAVPVLTYLTDFSVHPLWVARGVDVHLAAHPVPAGQAIARGAHRVLASGPVVGPRFTPADPRTRAAARARFGLPADAPLALLVAGSWGVGPVESAAAHIRRTGLAHPLVVCGHNQALAARLRAAGTGHVFGWVDDMPGLMHAADVLVQNAGGLTSLEALACGLPVLSYGCIPGHGLTNAAALDEAGLAPWIRAEADLAPALDALLAGPEGLVRRAAGLALFDTPPAGGPVAAVLDCARSGVPAPATAPQPVPAAARSTALDTPARRLPRRRTAVMLAAAVTSTLLAGSDGEDLLARGGTELLHAIDR